MFKGICFALVVLLAGCATESAPTKEAPMPAGAERTDKECDSPLGKIRDGGSAMGYLQPSVRGGQTCSQGNITCANGVWSGAYIYPSCTRTPQ